jgi:hypothetical protein
MGYFCFSDQPAVSFYRRDFSPQGEVAPQVVGERLNEITAQARRGWLHPSNILASGPPTIHKQRTEI